MLAVKERESGKKRGGKDCRKDFNFKGSSLNTLLFCRGHRWTREGQVGHRERRGP